MEYSRSRTAVSSITRMNPHALVVLVAAAATATAALLALVQPAAAFSPRPHPATTAVVLLHEASRSPSRLYQEAPKYQKHQGILRRSECVGKGSYLLTIDYNNNNNKDEEEEGGDAGGYPTYSAGHVLALEIQPPSTETSSSSSSEEVSAMTTMTEKTQKDLEANGGWLRGPYTVSFGYGDDGDGDDGTRNDGFRVLVKEVGYKSHVFATSPPGTPVLFGGKFKVPIAEGIVAASQAVTKSDNGNGDGDASSCCSYGETKRVVMISSGVGIGPCVGAIEELTTGSSSSSSSSPLSSSSSSPIGDCPLELIASFRTREEISMESSLEKLRSASSNVHWKTVVTGETGGGGRLTSGGAQHLRDEYLRSPTTTTTTIGGNCSAVTNTHYHIIGNGQMVAEWKEGLSRAGVPPARVTVEAYFNHAGKPDPSAVSAICEAVRGLDDDNDNDNGGSQTTTETKTGEAASVSV